MGTGEGLRHNGGAGEVGWVEDAGMESEGKLSMMCWNVCGLCNDGGGMCVGCAMMEVECVWVVQ